MSIESKGKKATFLLSSRLLDEVKAIVREGSFRSIKSNGKSAAKPSQRLAAIPFFSLI